MKLLKRHGWQFKCELVFKAHYFKHHIPRPGFIYYHLVHFLVSGYFVCSFLGVIFISFWIATSSSPITEYQRQFCENTQSERPACSPAAPVKRIGRQMRVDWARDSFRDHRQDVFSSSTLLCLNLKSIFLKF